MALPNSWALAPARPQPLQGDRTARMRRWRPARRDAPLPRRHDQAAAAAAAGSSGARWRGSSGAATGIPCHYDTLGLPRSANRAEVKRAFRRLARLWHPDVNPSPAASEHFKAIARAFEVLSDEQRRRRYDEVRWGHSSSGSSSGAARQPGGAGAEQPPPDLHAALQLDFREAALGAECSLEVEAMDACRACTGTGAAPGTVAQPCPMCKGRREIVKRRRPGPHSACSSDAGHAHVTICCPICVGRGFSVTHPCPCCCGVGLARRPRRVAVRVPAGAEDGGQLRLVGQGDVARVGGPRGGLVVDLEVGHEEGMWRQGLDLHSQLAVPLWDALLGGTATVSTLRGAASLTIPPGTQHGAVLSLAHAGVEQEGGGCSSSSSGSSNGSGGSGSREGWDGQQPRRGSHHFRVVLELPREVSAPEQALLQRLAELQWQRQKQGRAHSSRGKG